ncbi:MAG: hypothetical protein ACE5R6_14330 [Candidatus Heimdallarchaeota archaeon]
MTFHKEALAYFLEDVVTLPNVEACILYSRGGTQTLIIPPTYDKTFLLKQIGFVIRSEWSLRDILTDPERWRISTRRFDSYVIFLAQLSPMFILGIVLTDLNEKIEKKLLNAVEHIRTTYF